MRPRLDRTVVVLALVVATAVVAGIGRRDAAVRARDCPADRLDPARQHVPLPGRDDAIVRIGPFAPTWTGLEAALQATLRVVAFALSVAVFALTTPTDDLRRGPRAARARPARGRS